MKKKSVLLAILVILFGVLAAGGTFAWMMFNATTSNGTYQTGSTCFVIDYTDNSNQITGTMFPSLGPSGGLSGYVTMKLNDSCDVSGVGVLTLNVTNNTSAKFGDIVDPHCEDNNLITLPDYTTSGDCSSHGGTWVTDGTALKFTIYDNATFTGNPISRGCFYSALIGNGAPVTDELELSHIAKTYYIYVWLDGHLSDNTYTNLHFDGSITASATQTED